MLFIEGIDVLIDPEIVTTESGENNNVETSDDGDDD